MDDEIASQLSKIAKKEDKTSFAVANECLGEALKICEQGGHPEEDLQRLDYAPHWTGSCSV